MTVITRSERFVMGRPQWWLGAMLLALHAALAWGIELWWSRAFLLAHFGLFLLWQPVWRGERDVELRHAFLVVTVGFLLAAWSSWWLMAVWLAVLFGLIGGSVPGIQDSRQRLTSVLAAVYLLSLLLIWVVPHLFRGQTLDLGITTLVRYGLPLVPFGIVLIKVTPRQSDGPVAVDLFYSVILFLLVAALVLGSFVIREVSQGEYVVALAQTLFVIALLLVAMSWLWNPHTGFAGLGQLLSRYLMSLGLPFERWVQGLATLADDESDPEKFCAGALNHMLELPWVSGVKWETRLSQGEIGLPSEHRSDLGFGDLQLRIYARWSLSPTVVLHLRLLTQMVGHFYEAKRREQQQRKDAYTQAIYETGARLTHDVKNMLQSLRSLCSAAESSRPGDDEALLALMRRQLPQITQRLNTTLDKLKTPSSVDHGLCPAQKWWDAFVARHGGRAVEFAVEGVLDQAELPNELFDSVADNLVENAFGKDAGVSVRVTLSARAGVALKVCDSGKPVPRHVVGRLFEEPVASQTGLGVGLYHAARQAAHAGYELKLLANEPGSVCFGLMPAGSLR